MLKTARIITFLIIVFSVLLVFSAGVFAESNKVGIVTGNGVNVRKSPDLSADVVTQLNRDAKVKVIEDSSGWYHISYENTTGWMHGDYISIREEVIASGVINASAVNVRAKASLSSDVVTRLDEGIKLEVYERTAEWYRIKLADGSSGWVYKKYLTIRDSGTSRGIIDDASVRVDEVSDEKSPAQTSGDGQKIVEYAKKLLGVKYVYGGSSPKGFDCSGFVSYVFKHFGISLDRTSRGQSQNGTKVDKKNLKVGDLVFFDTNGGLNRVNHVGIYIGNGNFIHASSGSSKRKVVISSLNDGFYRKTYMAARRYIK